MHPQRRPATSEISKPRATLGYAQIPNSIIENIWALTPAEFAFAVIVIRRRENTVSDEHWENWTGKSARIKDHAILGLKQKGLNVRGEGDKAKYYFDRNHWDSWVRGHTRRERAHTAGRSKSVTAKAGMQVHQECRERGCGRLCDSQVIPFPATPLEKQVSQDAEAKPAATKPAEPPGAARAAPGSGTQILPTDILLQQLIGVFLSLGIELSETDLRKCGKFWALLTSSEKTSATAYAIGRAEGEWGDRAVRYVPRPWNFLREKQWERHASTEGRVKSKSKRAQALDAAAKRFTEAGGDIWKQN